jgi:N-acetylglucosamine kinase-like BadF-type ATPase
MTQQIYIGIDTGGTRTNVDILDPAGMLPPHTYEVPTALSGSITPVEYVRILKRILAGAETYWSTAGGQAADRSVYMFISAAGYAPSVKDYFVDALNEVLPKALNGSISATGVANDAACLLLGHDADVIVIAGTGSSVLVRSKDGTLHQIGGHEWVVSDYGSGFWIGLRAIRRAYRDHEDEVDSVLLQRLIQLFGIRSSDTRRLVGKLRDLSIADENMKPEVARFAAAVCAAAGRGDNDAQNIVKGEAEDLADVTASAIRRYFSQDQLATGLKLVQSGGLLTDEFYRNAFESQIQMRLRTGAATPTPLAWKRVATGVSACLNLAERIAEGDQELVQLDPAFRPLVMRFH